MNLICPVCGYPDLYEPAYDGEVGSQEICHCCGYQFGFTDYDSHITHEEWREEWIKEGMPWRSLGRAQPYNWNPKMQLWNIGIKL